MQPGDIFKIDNDAIVDMEDAEFSVMWAETPDKKKPKDKVWHRLVPGTQFRITKEGLKGLPVEVRASKINPITGKCGRGRPRRFPAEVCYRLLGETPPDPALTLPVGPAVYDPVNYPEGAKRADDYLASKKLEAELEEVVLEQPEMSAEEKAAQKAAQEERVASLLGLIEDDATDDDW